MAASRRSRPGSRPRAADPLFPLAVQWEEVGLSLRKAGEHLLDWRGAARPLEDASDLADLLYRLKELHLMFPVYLKEDGFEEPDDPIYYLVTRDGLFQVKRNPLFHARTKVRA